MAESKWVSVKEREPNRMHTLILCYDSPVYLNIVDEAKYDFNRHQWYNCYLNTWIDNERIKAWMYMPEPFTEKE